MYTLIHRQAIQGHFSPILIHAGFIELIISPTVITVPSVILVFPGNLSLPTCSSKGPLKVWLLPLVRTDDPCTLGLHKTQQEVCPSMVGHNVMVC